MLIGLQRDVTQQQKLNVNGCRLPLICRVRDKMMLEGDVLIIDDILNAKIECHVLSSNMILETNT